MCINEADRSHPPINTTLPVISSNTPVDDKKNQLSMNKQIDFNLMSFKLLFTAVCICCILFRKKSKILVFKSQIYHFGMCPPERSDTD